MVCYTKGQVVYLIFKIEPESERESLFLSNGHYEIFNDVVSDKVNGYFTLTSE